MRGVGKILELFRGPFLSRLGLVFGGMKEWVYREVVLRYSIGIHLKEK